MNLLQKANQLFKEGKYDEALRIYQNAKKVYGFSSLDFNIKLCLKKLGKDYAINKPSVDIILPVYNALDDVKKCINSLYKYNSAVGSPTPEI